MTISAKIIEDSEFLGKRLTTFELRYPRFIHAEFMTHRQLSRNASSSRAIPVARMIEDVEADPAIPVEFGRNQKGMQSAGEHSEPVKVFDFQMGCYTEAYKVGPREAWLYAMSQAVHMARNFDAAGYHKQVVNRILEPYAHIKVVASATEWGNFFALRAHPDAQPEIQELALAMREALHRSISVPRSPRNKNNELGWHLPYITARERADMPLEDLQKVSAARCARVSYTTHEGKPSTLEQDLALYERLSGAKPPHASPLEHQARPLSSPGERPLQGNFSGWVQFRKMHPGECGDYDFDTWG
jgi:hypothetical protein